MLQVRESFAREVDASLRFPVVLFPQEEDWLVRLYVRKGL
jgi:hypothetical protein